eukprot:XP_012826978.1 PREDICTED: coiled-coil domain containing 56 isoform X3 [Xenopus tropicalis]
MLHSVTNLTCSAPLFVFTVNQLSDTLYYDASKAYLARALLTAYNFCLLIKLIERQNIHFRLSLNVRVAGHYGVRSIVDGYTFYSVSQEKFLDELEVEAKAARASYPKTSAN